MAVDDVSLRESRGATPPTEPTRPAQASGKPQADRASELIKDASRRRAEHRAGWGDLERRAAALYAYAGRFQDSIAVLERLIDAPETEFDLVDGLRQLAQDQADAAGRLGGPLDEAAGKTYDRLHGLIEAHPQWRTRYVSSLSMAYAREVSYRRHARQDPHRAREAVERFDGLDPDMVASSLRLSVYEAAPGVMLACGDRDEALQAHDRLVSVFPEVLERFERRAHWELWRLNILDPTSVADGTVAVLEELADQALERNEPSQWNLARRLIDARLARGEADDAYAWALRLIHRVDELRGDPARAAQAASDQPWTPPADRLSAVEVDVLNRLEDAHLAGRPDIRLFALTRLQALTDDPGRRMDYARRIQDLQQPRKQGN